MRWVRDNTGRFRQRPHYQSDELEQVCEDAITGFLRERHGKAAFPVGTADLTVLIEQAVDDLDNDVRADLNRLHDDHKQLEERLRTVGA